MNKRFAAGLAGAALLTAGSFSIFAPGSSAVECNTTQQAQPTAGNEGIGQPVGPSNSQLYKSPGAPGSSTSGYVGLKGSTGFIEAKGSASGTPGGEIRGSVYGQPVDGRLTGDANGNVTLCVAKNRIR